MYVTNDFCDIPGNYFTDRNLLEIYNHYKRQYLEHGEFIVESVKPELMESLVLAADHGIPAKPDTIVRELKKAFMVREFYKRICEVESNIDRDKENIIVELQVMSKYITEMITEIEEAREYNHKESVFSYLKELEEAKKHRSAYRGISSHLPDLDKIISGWETGKVYLISGLEKLGKSRFVRSMVSHWLKNGHGCAFFMLEEDEFAIHECLLANRCSVNTDVLGTNAISKESIIKVFQEANNYMNEPLFISVKSGMTPQQIRASIQRQKIKMKNDGKELKFAIVDYVQRMTAEGDNQHEKTEFIASELANIARDENICMIEISQMSSGAEKQKGLPLHTQIRFGKVFKEAANCIITFDDPQRMNKDNNSNESWDINDGYKMLIAHIIQRRGMSDITIPIRAQLQFSSFHNVIK